MDTSEDVSARDQSLVFVSDLSMRLLSKRMNLVIEDLDTCARLAYHTTGECHGILTNIVLIPLLLLLRIFVLLQPLGLSVAHLPFPLLALGSLELGLILSFSSSFFSDLLEFERCQTGTAASRKVGFIVLESRCEGWGWPGSC